MEKIRTNFLLITFIKLSIANNYYQKIQVGRNTPVLHRIDSPKEK